MYKVTKMNFIESSHEKNWLYGKEENLKELRQRANQLGIRSLIQHKKSLLESGTKEDAANFPVQSFAHGYLQKRKQSGSAMEVDNNDEDEGDKSDDKDNFLNPDEELLLIEFFTSKLAELIGPDATMNRLKRDIKVTSTAAILVRRFFCSNSVMCFDPKAMMVAAAFLASKVEDATVDVRYLEEATQRMKSPVPLASIITAELQLLNGINYELNIYHPYKTVLAYTEDLRHFFKSSRSSNHPSSNNNNSHKIGGEDLRPIHDTARQIVQDLVLYSDLPLLYTPGQLGLAAMMVANQILVQKSTKSQNHPMSNNITENVPKIDYTAYIKARFESQYTSEQIQQMIQQMKQICQHIQQFLQKHNENSIENNMEELKRIHKKLKLLRKVKEKKKKKKKNSNKRKGKSQDVQEGETTTSNKEKEEETQQPTPKRPKIKLTLSSHNNNSNNDTN